MSRFGSRRGSEHIEFIRGTCNKENTDYSRSRNKGSKFLHLLDEKSFLLNILKIIPRDFTITTNNGSSQFNIKLLEDSSSVILKHRAENPNSTEYHIDVDDKDNILSKFEKLYIGEHVTFVEEELPVCKKITNILNLKCFPNYMKSENLATNERVNCRLKLDDGIEIYYSSFVDFAKNSKNKTFKINVNGQKYECNYFGVLSSSKIQDFISKNPKANEYDYDYSNENNEFQLFCKFFNFIAIDITLNNMDALNKISEDLQITCIIPKINDYIVEYEKFSQKIDEQQTKVDLIEELFEWLYDIQKLTVETVKSSILESIWIKEEEDVIELAAFILQVINSTTNLHPYLIDLLNQLDKESNETNKLNILVPFVAKQLMFNFGVSLSNCSFIYILYKNGFISKDKLFEKIKDLYDERRSSSSTNNNIQVWFMPELIELKQTSIFGDIASIPKETLNPENPDDSQVRKRKSRNEEEQKPFKNFIKSYYPEKIDIYEKMRDNREPDDALTKALLNDDVDTAQSIISQSDFDINKFILPYNIFDDFNENGRMKLINYAAAYGSIKCFKYLFVNHSGVDEITFKYAVYGGNTEIIKIVDQHITKIREPSNIILYAIKGHKNKLFDWILEHKLFQSSKINASFLLNISARNGNAHSLIEIADKFVDDCDFKETFEDACQNGFYRLAILTDDITNKKLKQETEKRRITGRFGSYRSKESVSGYRSSEARRRNDNSSFSTKFTTFGNLSIFKLGIKNRAENIQYTDSLIMCIEKDYKNIFNYFFDEIINEDSSSIILKNSLVDDAATKAITTGSNYYLVRLFDRIKQVNNDFLKSYSRYSQLLVTACEYKNIENIKFILGLMKEKEVDYDITKAFIAAAKAGSTEICQCLIDSDKTKIDNQQFFDEIDTLGSLKKDIYSIILESSTPELRESFLLITLNSAISHKNKELVQFLLNENVKCNDALINATKSNDIDIVNIVLDHNSSPSFINKKSGNGTALYIATNNNNLEIVKRLLSIPGIDPNLYDNDDKTPLISSIVNFNLDTMNEILNFYGESIQTQTWQLNKAIIITLGMLSSNTSTRKTNDDARNERRSWGRRERLKLSEMSNKKTLLLKILNRILQIKNIDPNLHGGEHTLLSYACETNEINIVQMLLETEKIDVNAYAPKNGNTPLMLSIVNDNLEIAELLIKDKRTNINAINYENKTSLIFAVEKGLEKIVSELINNEKFDPVDSCLDYAFYISKSPISSLLLTYKSIDVNYEYSDNTIEKRRRSERTTSSTSSSSYLLDRRIFETPLTNAVKLKDIEKVNLIVSHSSFNKVKSQLIRSIFESIIEKNVEIFRILLKLVDDDINISNYSKSTPLDVAIHYSSADIISEIINNEKFYKEKNSIEDIFKRVLLNNNFSADTAERILEFDEKNEHLIDLNKCFPNGQSYFTILDSRNSKHQYQKVSFLLDHGADPNKPDDNGVYPLAYAIFNVNENYISALLESNKIDLTKHITEETKKINSRISNGFDFIKDNMVNFTAKYTTYLHLAAMSNYDILNKFLEIETININELDEQGNTPVMYAAASGNSSVIDSLFEFSRQEIDYKHVNNDGNNLFTVCKERDGSQVKLDELVTKEDVREAILEMPAKKAKRRFRFGSRRRNEDNEKSVENDQEKQENEEKENNENKDEDENKEKDENKDEDIEKEGIESKDEGEDKEGSENKDDNEEKENNLDSVEKSPSSLQPKKLSFAAKTSEFGKKQQSEENNSNSENNTPTFTRGKYSFARKTSAFSKNNDNEENDSNSEGNPQTDMRSKYSFGKKTSAFSKNNDNEENDSKIKSTSSMPKKQVFGSKTSTFSKRNEDSEKDLNSENKSPTATHGKFSFGKKASTLSKTNDKEENDSNSDENQTPSITSKSSFRNKSEQNESTEKSRPVSFGFKKKSSSSSPEKASVSNENNQNDEKSSSVQESNKTFEIERKDSNEERKEFESSSNQNDSSLKLLEKQQKEEDSLNSFDQQNKEISKHLNSGFEQEIESAITDVLKNASPDVVKAITEKVCGVTSRKIKSIEKNLPDNNNALELSRYQPNFVQQLDYQDQMMQQQWQQLMQINYNSQYQFNMQMQQMQALQMMNANNQSKKKRKNKSKK